MAEKNKSQKISGSLLFLNIDNLSKCSYNFRMQNDFFEWDDDKAEANLRKHGVSFDEACTAVFDDFAVTFKDDREDYGEDRYFTVGESSRGRLLAVIWTPRNNRYRLISAFKPDKQQRKDYDKQRH